MQDGAPPHWGLQIHEWLNETPFGGWDADLSICIGHRVHPS